MLVTQGPPKEGVDMGYSDKPRGAPLEPQRD